MSSTQGPPPQGKTLKPSPSSAKTLYKTPSAFEDKFGYYRGVRHGAHIFISGTTAVTVGAGEKAPQIQFPGDAARQARVAFDECVRAVRALGGTREDVVRVRMFVSRHEDCGSVGAVFREMFARTGAEGDGDRDGGKDGDVGAAATMIVVRDGFVDPDMLVEVEVDAIVVD